MTLAELIKRLRELLDTLDLAKDLRDKLEELLRALEAGEPTATVIARLLADLLELGADRLPAPIAEFIKAYAEAFRNAIDEILRVLWERYKRLREQGFDHQEANDTVTLDAQTCAWLRFRWALEQWERNQPPQEPPEPMGPGEEPPPPPPGTPPPSGPPPEPVWAAEDDECCRKLRPAERIPSVNLINGCFYFDRGNWFVDIDLEITHRCGLKGEPHTRIYIVPFPGRPGIKLEGDSSHARDASGGRGVRKMWRRQMVSAREPHEVKVHVKATSKCMGIFDGFVSVQKRP
jgi:hypothetical protein